MTDSNEKLSNPEGWTDDMRPLPEVLVKTPVFGVDDTSGQPVVTPAEETVDEGAEYWRKKFEEANTQNEKDAPYKTILNRLKEDGDLVSVLEQHISGEMVELQQTKTIFDGDEEDEYGNPIKPDEQNQPNAKSGEPTAGDVETIRKQARMEAQAEMELKQFVTNLMTVGGVPDHVADKFVHTIHNPTGFNVADLYAAFMNKETRESAVVVSENKREEKQTPMGVPVTSAGGATDKPTGDRFKETPDSDGQNFVTNPNVL